MFPKSSSSPCWQDFVNCSSRGRVSCPTTITGSIGVSLRSISPPWRKYSPTPGRAGKD
ncbi:hypothetical protein VFPFJ_10337 [Purpureocillium lilacinum]|uniref:Uncharacterized protein n=1 Tax=Purpureocillium lilacinum TaxID=33203 RepID=A0A179GKP6_PURLI|nr:hypothetical protein VFPFJ_10337 [Purpureocillium lilacinum]OAQ77970.1 hypothetical protein VFPFJ_10337 [Purpureocillium lilacinum]